MKNSIMLVAVAALVAGSVTLAKAATPFEPRSVTVQYADLDTSNTPGAAALYRRLKSAVVSVCRDLEPGRELARVDAYAACMHFALSNAIVKIDRPVVTAYAVALGVTMSEPSIRIARNK